MLNLSPSFSSGSLWQSPTTLFSNHVQMASAGIFIGQYRLFFVIADSKTPYCFNANIESKTQKTLSKITTLTVAKSDLHRRRRRDAVFPFSWYSWGPRRYLGRSSPSSISIPYMIPENEQQIDWYSLTLVYGFLGTIIHPGHNHFLIHVDMLSSKQETHPTRNIDFMWSLNAAIISLTHGTYIYIAVWI